MAQEQMAAQVTLQRVSALGHLSRTEHRDEAFYRQLQVASSLQAPVLKGDFTKLGIFWMTNTAQHKQPRRFLESTNDNLLTKRKKKKKDKELDFLLTNKA